MVTKVSRCGTVNCVRVACVTAKSVWISLHLVQASISFDKVATYMQIQRFKYVWEQFPHLKCKNGSECRIGMDCPDIHMQFNRQRYRYMYYTYIYRQKDIIVHNVIFVAHAPPLLRYWGFHEKGTLSYLCALGIDRYSPLNKCTLKVHFI